MIKWNFYVGECICSKYIQVGDPNSKKLHYSETNKEGGLRNITEHIFKVKDSMTSRHFGPWKITGEINQARHLEYYKRYVEE